MKDPLALEGLIGKSCPFGIFFSDLPLIGRNASVKRKMCRVLRRRARSDWETIWKDSASRAAALKVGEIIADYFFWPSPYFVPDDEIDCIIWGAENLQEACEALSNALKIDSFDIFLGCNTYGQFIEKISPSLVVGKSKKDIH